MNQSIFQHIKELKEHEHLAHLYYNDSESYEIAAHFISHALSSGTDCAVVSDRRAPFELTSRLIGRGAISSQDGYLKTYNEIIIKHSVKENKRSSAVVSEIKQSIEKILKKGSRPLCVLIMHSDLFYFLSNKERLWKKAFLNKLCIDKPIIMLSQYPVGKTSSLDILSVMKTHPKIVENNIVYDSPMYVHPETIIKDFDNEHDRYKALSSKEQRVLVLITSGLSNSAIAEELSLSVKTVETHRANIMKKLDIHNLVDLVKFSMRNGIV